MFQPLAARGALGGPTGTAWQPNMSICSSLLPPPHPTPIANLKTIPYWKPPGSPVVRTWRFHCKEAQVQSLVMELRSCKPHPWPKKNAQNKKPKWHSLLNVLHNDLYPGVCFPDPPVFKIWIYVRKKVRWALWLYKRILHSPPKLTLHRLSLKGEIR